RSKRPWRTLFERTLGALHYGAVLSLPVKAKSHVGHELGRPSTEDGGAQTGEFGAGKVVWANEGFEKLAGVDAFDIVGQDIISLFQEGGDTEDEKGGELKRNLELSTSCMLWMAMVGQQDDFTDVLCLHQPVAVPPQLSDEGRYSVLLFFDTASVQIENPEADGRGGEGGLGRVEGESRGSAVPPGRQQPFEADEEGKGIDRKQQACHDLSKAMASLLTDTTVDVGKSTGEGETSVAPNGNNNDGLAFIPDSCSRRNSRTSDSHIVGGGRWDKLADGEAGDEIFGEKVRGRGGTSSAGREQQYLSSVSGPTPPPTSPSPLPLADVVHKGVEVELEGELLGARLARECGIVDDLHDGGSIEEPPTLRAQRKYSDGSKNDKMAEEDEEGEEEEEEEGHRTSRSRQTLSSFSKAAESSGTADYPSGDDSSAEPRADLLLPSPRHDWKSTKKTLMADEQILLYGGDEQVAQKPHDVHGDTCGGSDTGSNDRSPAFNPAAVEARHPPAANNIKKAKDGTATTVKNEKGSDDPYEDDFCDDEDESLSSAWSGEGDGTRKSIDKTTITNTNKTTITNTTNSNNNNSEVENGSGLMGGGIRGIVGGFDDGSDDSMYSDTVAGGLEVSNSSGANENFGKDELSWGGSPEG
ncbi:unnamed protein product, partial [Pylaiella littoralis]